MRCVHRHLPSSFNRRRCSLSRQCLVLLSQSRLTFPYIESSLVTRRLSCSCRLPFQVSLPSLRTLAHVKVQLTLTVAVVFNTAVSVISITVHHRSGKQLCAAQCSSTCSQWRQVRSHFLVCLIVAARRRHGSVCWHVAPRNKYCLGGTSK